MVETPTVLVSKTLAYSTEERTDEGLKVPSIVRSNLFAELLSLARPVVKHYQSDHYHDALWIERNLQNIEDSNDLFWFYYGVREHGTHIGTDGKLFRAYSDKLFNVTVARNDGKWNLIILDVTNS